MPTQGASQFALGKSGFGDEATAMSDKQVRQEILDVFQWDPRVDAARIEVSVEHGIVTLTGTVGSDDDRIAAAEAIRHVDGVRQLIQNIEVWPSASAPEHEGRSELEISTD